MTIDQVLKTICHTLLIKMLGNRGTPGVKLKYISHDSKALYIKIQFNLSEKSYKFKFSRVHAHVYK